MYILGFNSTHDSSAALVKDGEIVCAVEEERFTRQKHYYGFPEHSIEACLKAGGIEFKDLDHVAFYWDIHRGKLSFLLHVLRHFPKSLAYFDHQPGIYGSFRNLPKFVRKKYGWNGEFHFMDHHRNHIASSFWPSPFPDAAALTVDGTGEWATTVLARVNGEGPIEVLRTSNYPHSIGKLCNRSTVLYILAHSSVVISAQASLRELILLSEATRFLVIWSELISSEANRTFLPNRAAVLAVQSAKVVFPIPGRAAYSVKVEPCKP